MAKGDFGAGAKLRPLHFTVSIVVDEASSTYQANATTGIVGAIVSGADGRELLPARNFELDLDDGERAAATALVQRLLDQVVADEGLAGIYVPETEDAAAAE